MKKSIDLAGELKRIADFAATYLIQSNEHYPASPRAIYDPPPVLNIPISETCLHPMMRNISV